MAGEVISGQLYRVGVTSIAPHERCCMDLLVVASSAQDAKDRLPWIQDLSEWTSYRIDSVAKEPQRCVVLKMKFERVPENEPDASIERREGSQPVFQRVSEPTGDKYRVTAHSVLYAKNPDHAKRKLAQRIEGGSEFVKFQVEAVAAPSAYATARDVSMFPRASIVRG